MPRKRARQNHQDGGKPTQRPREGKGTAQQRSQDLDQTRNNVVVNHFSIKKVESLQTTDGRAGKNIYQSVSVKTPSPEDTPVPISQDERLENRTSDIPKARRCSFHIFWKTMGLFNRALSILILPAMSATERKSFMNYMPAAFQLVFDLGPRIVKLEKEGSIPPTSGRRADGAVRWIRLGENVTSEPYRTTWCYVDDFYEGLDNATWLKLLQEDLGVLLGSFSQLARDSREETSVMLVWPKDDHQSSRMAKLLDIVVQKLPNVPNITVCTECYPVSEEGRIALKSLLINYSKLLVYKTPIGELPDAIFMQMLGAQKPNDRPTLPQNNTHQGQVSIVNRAEAVFQIVRGQFAFFCFGQPNA